MCFSYFLVVYLKSHDRLEVQLGRVNVFASISICILVRLVMVNVHEDDSLMIDCVETFLLLLL